MVQKIQKWLREYRWKLFRKTYFCRRQDAWKQNWCDHSLQSKSAFLSSIAYQVNAAYGTVLNIVTKKLKYWTAYTDWRCHLQKESRLLLKRDVSQPNSYRQWIMMPLSHTKAVFIGMEAQKLPHTTITRSKTSTGKVMLMLFFDVFGPILIEWMPKGTKIMLTFSWSCT